MPVLIVFEVSFAYFLRADHKPTNPKLRLVAKNSKLGEQNEVSLATLSQLSRVPLDLHLTKGHYI